MTLSAIEAMYADHLHPNEIVDVCAGYGGLSMGLAAATGATVSYVVENEPNAIEVLKVRHPEAERLEDLKEVDWSQVRSPRWMCAGFPCQPFSDAGHRLGADDPRHLWPWVLRGIIALRPDFVLLENVRGFVKRGLPEVLADLEAAGYGGAWSVVSAASVGAPHLRKRVFVLASRHLPPGFMEVKDSGAPLADLLPTPAARDSKGCDLASRQGGSGLPSAIATMPLMPTPTVHLSGRSAVPNRESAARRIGPEGRRNLEDAVSLLPTPRVSDSTGSGVRGVGGVNPREAVTLLPTPRATDVGTEGRRAGNGFRPPLSQVVLPLLPTPRATDGGNGGNGGPNQRGSSGDLAMPSVVHVDAETWGKFAPAIERWRLTTGHPVAEATEPGVRGGRRLASRFVEWMMGLPPGYVTDVQVPDEKEMKRRMRAQKHSMPVETVFRAMTNAAVFRLLGNGVVPPQCTRAVQLLFGSVRRLLPTFTTEEMDDRQ